VGLLASIVENLCSRGLFHKQMHAAFWMRSMYWQTAFDKWNTYLANIAHVCEMVNKFDKIQHSCSAKFRSFRVGETKWRINFLPSAVCTQLFDWRRRFGEMNPRSQFHQHFTSEFFVQKCFVQLFSSTILSL